MKDKAKHKKGFVLLFAVSLASILLAIAVGVSSIAEKEIKFGTSARDTGNAFFAADTGVECAVFHDKSLVSSFPVAGVESSVTCARILAPLDFYTTENGGIYYFNLIGLGQDNDGDNVGDGCAKISVEKDIVSDPIATRTIVISKGYNTGDANCDSASPSRVEREIEVSYVVDNPPSGPPPAAGFPVIRGMAQGSQSPDSTIHNITLPNSIAEGDLLLVFFSMDNKRATITWPVGAGWQSIFKTSDDGGDTLEARYKVAGSSEPTTFQISTSRIEMSAYQAFRITNFNTASAPSAVTINGSSTTPDPPALTLASAKKILWIAVAGRQSGSDPTIGYPADYSNNISKQTGGKNGGTTVDTAVRILETSTEDPGVFTIAGGSKKWGAATVAIEGQPAP